jgi:putative glutamine amidotransferase
MSQSADGTAVEWHVASDAGPDPRPLIGVTTSELRPADHVTLTPHGEPPRREMALGLTYLRAIEHAGGIPVAIPPLPVDAIPPLLKNLHGVLLSGGPDIHPEAYGESPHPELGPTWRDLDAMELALARLATASDLPTLAISRGAQALNIARGGTLFQHLPERFGRAIQHRQLGNRSSSTHPVEIAEDSVLAGAIGCTTLQVNSYHHQATSGLGRGVRAVAWAPDGVVEAIEVPQSSFAVGVQWHAESMPGSTAHARLFTAFVAAASGAAREAAPEPAY